MPADVAEREDCRRAVEAAVARFGRLNALLCCAGISMRGPLHKSDLDVLTQVMQVNFFGTLYPAYFAIPHLKETHGSLAAVTSLAGKRGTPYYAMYGASKFAVQGLFASLRVEGLAPAGVHVGIVAWGSSIRRCAGASPGARRANARHTADRTVCASGRWRNASIASSICWKSTWAR